VRELLINVVKHAQASTASVSLSVKDGRLRLEVRDDGVGFDAAQSVEPSATGGGFGLFSIRERLAYLGGTVAIRSSPGRGTRVTVVAPLHAADRKDAREAT